MAPRTVLLYSDGPIYGGAERYLVELARGLNGDDWKVDLACAEDGALDPMVTELRSYGVPTKRLPAIPTLKARGPLLKVLRYFATHRRDILHFNLTDPRSCNGAMTAARMALRGRFVVTEHLPTSSFDHGPLPLRHRLALKSTAATIVNTATGASAVEQRPHYRGRIHVIANGIADPGEPTDEQRRAAWAALGFEGDELLIGWVGRFNPQKVPGLMVEGMRRVASSAPHVRFVFLGDGPEFRATEERVQELELGPVTKFWGFRDDARDLICGLDLLVNTSTYEGMPFTILEAMFASVPVVASRISGNEDLVAHLASGVLFTQQDGDSLGEALHTAIGNRDRMLHFGQVGRQRALALHSLEGMCDRTAKVYEEVLGGA